MDAARARHDTRDWAKARRDRTRHLIELGGLVAKAGLVELTGDDRATMLGAMLDLARQLRGEQGNREEGDGGYPGADPAHLRARWRRAGLRAFEADREATADAQESEQPSV